MFANVVRSRVLCSGESSSAGEVAIKIVRCQESMYVFYSVSLLRG